MTPPSILGFLRSSGSASLTLHPVAAIKVEVIKMPEQVSGSKMIKREHAKPHAQKVTECLLGVLNQTMLSNLPSLSGLKGMPLYSSLLLLVS